MPRRSGASSPVCLDAASTRSWVSHGLLAHATVTVLERNGHINPELFRELMGERPQRSAEIQAVADEFGFAALPVLATGALPAVRVRAPDYVVRDTYESLRAQRARLRAHRAADTGGEYATSAA